MDDLADALAEDAPTAFFVVHEWPEIRDVPDPWSVLPEDMETWLEIHVPRMNEYYWFIEGRPLARGVTHAWARWSIGVGARLRRLAPRRHPRPAPVAARGARHPQGVRGDKRTGFIMFEVQRWPTMDNDVIAKLSMKPTTTALDGSPLDPEGRTIPPTPS